MSVRLSVCLPPISKDPEIISQSGHGEPRHYGCFGPKTPTKQKQDDYYDYYDCDYDYYHYYDYGYDYY